MNEHPKRNRGWKQMGEIMAESSYNGLLDGSATPVEKPESWTERPLLTANSRRLCPHGCGRENGTIGAPRPGVGMWYLWEVCSCREAAQALESQQTAALVAAAHSAQATEVQVVNASLVRIAHFTLDTFASRRLQSEFSELHPLTIATRWLERILPRPHGDYRGERVPPAALYFYSGGNGRGKTHLAAGIINAAKVAGKRVAFANEQTYLQNRWGLPRDTSDAYTTLLSERAWLTVIDDMGARARVPETVADAYYTLLNDRWLGAKWTIITSNKTPDELLAQGTINIATWSRLGQMTEMQLVEFVGEDQRLV